MLNKTTKVRMCHTVVLCLIVSVKKKKQLWQHLMHFNLETNAAFRNEQNLNSV